MINRKDLIQALTLAAKIAPKRPNTPIINCVRLSNIDGALHIHATDCDQHLKLVVPAHGCNFAPFCAELAPLLACIKVSKEPAVNIEYQSGGYASIDGAKMPAHPAAEFPQDYDWTPNGGAITLTNSVWMQALDRVTHAASDERDRFYLNGAFFDRTAQNEISFVATNGHRLAMQSVAGDVTDTTRKPIVPTSALKAIAHLLRSETPNETTRLECVSTNCGSHGVRIIKDGFRYSSVTIDGAYPDYKRVIPTDKDASFLLKINAAELLGAAKSLLAIQPKVNLVLSVDGDQISLALADNEEASLKLTLTGESNATDFRVGFSAKYLIELAKTFPKNARLTIQMKDAQSAALITSQDAPGLTYVLMPVRV
jgi:DNA polymerase-3 subunit beta